MVAPDDERRRLPEFSIAGLRVWVLRREFEAAQDWEDGNWLCVVVQCTADGAEVRASGAILHLSQLQRWLTQTREVYQRLSGVAKLFSYEPNLDARLELQSGRGTLTVNITPDHLAQRHAFTFGIDQSYLPALIRSLEHVLDEYPVRGRG